MDTLTEMSVDEKILAEEKRLMKIFNHLDKDRLTINQKLINNAAFMGVTLQNLQTRINKDGAVIDFVNGNGFETINEHPAQKSYNTMINRYTVVIKQLTDLLNKDTVKDDKDELLEFLK